MRTLKLVLAVSVALSMIVVTGQAIAGPVRFKSMHFDPPGSDTLSNHRLNLEKVIVCTRGVKGRNMSRWSLTDKGADHTFRFPQGFKLKADRCVTVHTGRNRNTNQHLYMKLGNYVWNNDGDKATLRTRDGTRVDKCSYGSNASNPRRC